MKEFSKYTLHGIVIVVSAMVIITLFSTLKVLNGTKTAMENYRSLFPLSSLQFPPINPVDMRKILIIGDSVVRGLGTTSPHNTISGLISRKTGLGVRTCAAPGNTTQQLLDSAMMIDGEYEAVLVFVGGNDILYLTPIKEVANNTKEALVRISPKAKRVIVVGPPELGSCPLFSFPFPILLKKQAYGVSSSMAKACSEFENVIFINGNDFKAVISGDLFSSDGFHPGDTGTAKIVEIISTHLESLGTNNVKLPGAAFNK
jgi:lysophospholipase L1-like esterase